METKKRPKTAKYYKDIKAIHLDPYFGEVKVGRIDFALIEKYMAFKLTKGKLNKDSINKTVTALGTILKYAVRRKFIQSNPVPTWSVFEKGLMRLRKRNDFLSLKRFSYFLKTKIKMGTDYHHHGSYRDERIRGPGLAVGRCRF